MDPDNLEINEVTYKELLSKNKTLSDELKQCLQDKEFVWNLWKELQVTNPNTANIINSVIEREQEKSDAKDLKVLTVLQEKDQQINILQEISADLQTQLKHTSERISELLIEESDWQKKNEDFNVEINNLKAEINYKDQLHITKDKLAQDIENNGKQQIAELEGKIEEIMTVNTTLQQKVNSLNENLANIHKEKDDLKGSIVSKDENLLSVDAKLDGVFKEKEILINDNEVYKTNVKKLKTNLKKKTKEVEDVREYWENEVNSNIETINEQSERLEQQQQEILSLQKEVTDHANCEKRIEEQTNLIQTLERLQDESQNVFAQQQRTYEVEANLCTKTIKTLKKKLLQCQKEMRKTTSEYTEANILPVSLPGNNDGEINNLSPTSIKYVEKCTQTLPSMDCVNINDHTTVNSEIQSKNIEMLVNLVKSMEVDLQTTRVAHKQRLQRYKLLEENFNLLRQQLATYEDGTVKKETKMVRASAKSLQREGSKSVWNELEYYRQQYEKFKLERPKLNEELDQLKVERSHNDTLINKLKLEVEDFRKALYEKEVEIQKKGKVGYLDASKIKCLQDEVASCHERLSIMGKDYCELQKTYNTQIKREDMLQHKLNGLMSEIELLKSNINPVMKDGETQTNQNDNVEKFIYKAIVDVVPNKVNGSKLSDSCLLSVATQTLPERMKFGYMENATQTIETNNSVLQSELEKLKIAEEKDRVSCEYQQLQVLKDLLQQENENLKMKKSSLKEEVTKVMESERSIRKYVNNLESTNDKLKYELLESLQTLKETTEVLEGRSQEVEDYSQQLNVVLSDEQKGKIVFKKKLKEIKSIEKQLEEVTSKCTKLSFQVKTLTGENEILSDKQSTFQRRVGKLEKDLIQKKTQNDELKLKCEGLKNEANQNIRIIDNLKLKLKTVTERENNNKGHIAELKVKIDTLIKDKCILQNTLSSLQIENNNKTELLHKTQRLCHQAEVAINEIELSNLTQIENEQKLFENKNIKMNSCYQRCMKQLNEFRSVVKHFSEALILKICENHVKMLEIKKLKKKKVMEEKQCNLFGNKSSNIACSILGMSTQDLLEFMNEDTCIENKPFKYDNEMRNKLDVILKKEVHFEKELIQCLLELVKYNDNICQQLSSTE